ncbi:hypothetical protein D3C84_710880 [compost metagenome]
MLQLGHPFERLHQLRRIGLRGAIKYQLGNIRQFWQFPGQSRHVLPFHGNIQPFDLREPLKQSSARVTEELTIVHLQITHMGEVGIPLGQRLGTRQVQIKRGLLSADKTIAPALDQLIGHDPSRAASSRCRLDSVDPLGQCSVQCLEFPLPVVQQIEHLLVGISRAQAISDELTGLRIGNVRIDISNPGDQSAIGEADATTTGQVTETASRQAQRRPGAI